ncbi:hypothetical protein DPMN_061818 [Dreissena polymorpha]|uniref:Uncharacterized protein n=1 Tax=Dreissena polymorpha TaxID=45954 RepID=A0A9D4C844_DREPO|nr:hypothetical protein DPMN_061818 [Dreissena polymorpha]
MADREMAQENSTLTIQNQLTEVLAELQQQRNDYLSLKEVVRGSSLNVASEVKKLKVEKDIVWKFQGNKLQYEFNTDIVGGVKQCMWALKNGKHKYCKEQLTEKEGKRHKRNKCIRIADSSSGGWETVRQYESNPIAKTSRKFIRQKTGL